MTVSGLGALLLGAALAVVAVRWFMDTRHDTSSSEPPDIDYDQLNEAEREVRDLEFDVGPDEADEELKDWGPGAPK